jgi:NAD(P)-dependent dehydrogenase (short-subunit alcohol dehydrogenase family)
MTSARATGHAGVRDGCTEDPVAAFRLNGTHALVTGGSSGIGRSFAWTLARAGARVTVAARREERLQAVVAELARHRLQAQCVRLDVGDEDSVDYALWWASRSAFGAPQIVVNNAGVSLAGAALEQRPRAWDQVLSTNLRGPWLVAQAAARVLVEQELPGSIVNVASILGRRVAATVVPYAASKAGLLHMTRGLALEWARHGIRVNALLPGYIATELNADFLTSEAGSRLCKRIPTRSFATPADLDGALLLLVSGAGRHITGAEIAVDGGHLVSGL